MDEKGHVEPDKVDTILDSLNEMTILLDPDQRISYVNALFTKMTGYEPMEIKGKDMGQFIAPGDLLNLRRRLEDVLERKSKHTIHIVALNKEANKIPLEVELIPVVRQGKAVGIWIKGRDITDERRLTDEFEEMSLFIDKVITMAEEGFITVNRDGVILRWSKGAERILKKKAGEMKGRPFYTLLKDNAQRRRFLDRLRVISTGREMTDMEYSHENEEGREIHLNITGSPIVDRLTNHKETLIIIRDTTEKKHLEVRLKESEKRLAIEVIKRIEDLKYVEQLNRFVVQYMEEGALLLDSNMEIGFVNPKIVDLLGWKKKEMIGTSLEMLVPEDLLWVWTQIPKRSKGGSFKFESSLLRRDGEEVPVMVTASSIKVDTKKSEFLCTIIDLTDQRQKEEKMREEMLEYKIRRGNVYLLLEKGYDKVAYVLTALRRFGHEIIILSRRSNRTMLTPLTKDKEAPVFWMEEKGKGTHTIKPTKEHMVSFFEEKVKRTTAVVLDRPDYLISRMSFDGFVETLHELVDLIYQRKAILLLLAGPGTLKEEHLSRLEKDAPILEAKTTFILPDDLIEILLYIFKQDRMGVVTSYKDIGNRFNITKTTTRKRIQNLEILELLSESKKGRTKVLKLTEKGYRLVSPLLPRIR